MKTQFNSIFEFKGATHKLQLEGPYRDRSGCIHFRRWAGLSTELVAVYVNKEEEALYLRSSSGTTLSISFQRDPSFKEAIVEFTETLQAELKRYAERLQTGTERIFAYTTREAGHVETESMQRFEAFSPRFLDGFHYFAYMAMKKTPNPDCAEANKQLFHSLIKDKLSDSQMWSGSYRELMTDG